MPYQDYQYQNDKNFLSLVESYTDETGESLLNLEPEALAHFLSSHRDTTQDIKNYVTAYERIDLSVDEAFSPIRQKHYQIALQALNILNKPIPLK